MKRKLPPPPPPPPPWIQSGSWHCKISVRWKSSSAERSPLRRSRRSRIMRQRSTNEEKGAARLSAIPQTFCSLARSVRHFETHHGHLEVDEMEGLIEYTGYLRAYWVLQITPTSTPLCPHNGGAFLGRLTPRERRDCGCPHSTTVTTSKVNWRTAHQCSGMLCCWFLLALLRCFTASRVPSGHSGPGARGAVQWPARLQEASSGHRPSLKVGAIKFSWTPAALNRPCRFWNNWSNGRGLCWNGLESQTGRILCPVDSTGMYFPLPSELIYVNAPNHVETR